ncbi:hypothetical protein [Chryseobacterium cucumeris]|uniref:hypothetical protein n=1 Tax=Chryseobacterium cucumeris TaxID=1813611 RepID=UPI001F4BC8ED|nr:hypothetical protein [Chryseobacterium cucumeris]
MENLLNQHIKGFSTTIVKVFLQLLLITTVACTKMNEQTFKVFGKEDILKNTKINIIKIDDRGAKTENTLLFLGKEYDINAETEAVATYELYVSYKDSLVNILKFENVMRNANDHINHIYLNEENNSINVIYIGRESDVVKHHGFMKTLMPKNDFYKANNISDDKTIEKYNQLFLMKLSSS